MILSSNFEIKRCLLAGGNNGATSKPWYLLVFAPNTEYQKVKDALLSLYPDVNFLEDHTTWIPSSYVTLEDEHDKQKFERFMEMLDDCDDVQNIYHNISNE